MERVPFFCCLLLSLAAISSQVSAAGDLTGKMEYCGNTLPATIYIDKHSYYVISSDGSFTFHDVPAGTYDIVAELPAYLHFPAYTHTQSVTLSGAPLDLGNVWVEDPVAGCPLDSDGDGVIDDLDSCPFDPDPNCFTPVAITDVTYVGSTQWAQPDLFVNLTWTEINAVCPAGVCADGATLNGYDMTGWRWANADEVNAVFNFYLGTNAIGPGPDYLFVKDAPWATAIFDAGWRVVYTTTTPYSQEAIRGWLSNGLNGSGYAIMGMWNNNLDPGFTDVIDTRSIMYPGAKLTTLGAWFYKP